MLESAGRGKSGVLLVWTMKFVAAVGAEFAFAADAPDPFDAGSVADFPFVMHVIADSYHDTGTFMARDALGGRLHSDAEWGPFIMDEGFVGGTEAGPGIRCKWMRERKGKYVGGVTS